MYIAKATVTLSSCQVINIETTKEETKTEVINLIGERILFYLDCENTETIITNIKNMLFAAEVGESVVQKPCFGTTIEVRVEATN